MDRLILDASVLFFAAFHPAAGVARLWQIEGVALVTSSFAVQEAQRNLEHPGQIARLEELLGELEVGEALMLGPERRGGIDLPEKDWPILGGAVASGATHLITGDQRHFRQYFGRQILGVWIVKPGDYLRERSHG